jgi:hypothetical protein
VLAFGNNMQFWGTDLLKASQQVVQERVWSEEVLIYSIVEADLAPTLRSM